MSQARQLAVITGAASGIGAACARRFAGEGYAVALLDVARQAGQALADELAGSGAQARFYPCDVADETAVEQCVQASRAELGEPEVLVTSAALIPNTESILDMDMAGHDRMWRVNYHGTLHACRSVGRIMAQRTRGAIVTLGSINTLHPLPLPAYNPGKAALQRLTQLLAVELGRHQVRVNSVAPTYVMTPALQARIDAGHRDLDKMMSVHALAQLPVPDDIADAVAFLCSPQARMITGVLLPVDAGWSAGVSYKTYAGGVPWQAPANG
ncbi:SDR family NAD(P)-dependent oxidoreductase [Bordetella genomosp. 13]|uniref:Oxidoreductase n=1 Tax=Bordetella genomosp. 13 TaxID=463040 RepID=A0A1W6ZDD4_9BORD|nr:SDR family oxidoreductase [Bordetella genomosp. 13]ARP95160.1 oxidoreductase [Bordetella genomosp. 13]